MEHTQDEGRRGHTMKTSINYLNKWKSGACR